MPHDVLTNFELREPEILTAQDDAWPMSGAVKFAVGGYPPTPATEAALSLVDTYGERSDTRASIVTAAELVIGFKDAASEEDALRQAAEQLRDIAKLFSAEADRLST